VREIDALRANELKVQGEVRDRVKHRDAMHAALMKEQEKKFELIIKIEQSKVEEQQSVVVRLDAEVARKDRELTCTLHDISRLKSRQTKWIALIVWVALFEISCALFKLTTAPFVTTWLFHGISVALLGFT